MYPLGEFEKNSIRSKTGKSVDDITLSAVVNGEVHADDIKISAEMLNRQADVARTANRPQLAENFQRAGELIDVPDELIMEIYNKMRPNRSTKQELIEIGNLLQNKYNAVNCARLVFEAAEVYEKRGVLQ